MMPTKIEWRLTWLFAVVLVLLGLGRSTVARAQDDRKAPADEKSRKFLTTGQEPVEPFVPLNPRTVDDTRRLEAVKQFCIACRLENQYRWNDAIEAYRKALENDPNSLAIFKSLIKTCRAARRMQEATQYMREALERDAEDFEMLDWLGDTLAEQGQIEQAVDYFKRSLASPKLPKRHPAAVILKHKLGTINEIMKNYGEAAGYFRDVMDAMERPADYNLNNLEMTPTFLRNRADTYERFAGVFRQAKRFDDSLRALRLAQAASPRTTRFSLNLADLYIDQEKYPQALEYLEKYLNEQTPQGSQPYERLALVLGKLGRSDEVLPRVQAAAEKDRFNNGLQYFLGTLHEAAGQYDKALEIYAQVLKNPPDNRVYKSLAGIYRKENRLRDLVLLMGDGLEKQLENRGAAGEAVQEQLVVLSSDPEAAKATIEVARELYRADEKQFKFGARYFIAWVARSSRLFDEAAEFFRYAIELRPQLPRLHRELAAALAFTSQTEEAIQSAKKAVELDGKDFDNVDMLGRLFLRAAQADKAKDLYESALRTFEDDDEATRDARYALSNIYYQLGDMPKAEKTLEEILERHPDDAPANNDLGYFWADQCKNLDQAEKMIRKALDRYAVERQPGQPEKNAAYLDSMGWVLYKLGRPEDARKYLEDALTEKEGIEDGTIVDHLGDVFLRLKQPAKAKEMWLKAKEILENAKGAEREEKRLQEINEKLKSLEDAKRKKSESRQDS